jgi:hypothetical protein
VSSEDGSGRTGALPPARGLPVSFQVVPALPVPASAAAAAAAAGIPLTLPSVLAAAAAAAGGAGQAAQQQQQQIPPGRPLPGDSGTEGGGTRARVASADGVAGQGSGSVLQPATPLGGGGSIAAAGDTAPPAAAGGSELQQAAAATGVLSPASRVHHVQDAAAAAATVAAAVTAAPAHLALTNSTTALLSAVLAPLDPINRACLAAVLQLLTLQGVISWHDPPLQGPCGPPPELTALLQAFMAQAAAQAGMAGGVQEEGVPVPAAAEGQQGEQEQGAGTRQQEG